MSAPEMAWREGLLALADGSVFEGEVLGFDEPEGSTPAAAGEVVFNTVMTGYQEVLTDPSYAGQMISFTYPHIGNYGVAPDDDESRRPFCRGVIVRELTGRPSNWRAVEPLAGFLRRHGLQVISGVDTRRLTRQIRDGGAMPGAFGPVDAGPGSYDEASLLAAARAEPTTDGRDLVAEVTCSSAYRYGDGPFEVVAYDFGIKRNILRNLARMATRHRCPGEHAGRARSSKWPPTACSFPTARATRRPSRAPPKRSVACSANCPCSAYAWATRSLPRPLALRTYKLPFGHHGGNHPVRRIATGAVEITSQNHNYAVAPGTFGETVQVSHINLNDGVIEGFICTDVPAFSVQYHPEAGPGPHDARYLFGEFAELMRRCGATGRAGYRSRASYRCRRQRSLSA